MRRLQRVARPYAPQAQEADRARPSLLSARIMIDLGTKLTGLRTAYH